jgi:hypothetical protein
MIEKIDVLDKGLLYCSVCTNIKNREQIEKAVNDMPNLIGEFGKKWKICSDSIHNDEETIKTYLRQDINKPKPSMICDLIPYTHKHFFLQCYSDSRGYSKSPEPKRIVKYIPKITHVPETEEKALTKIDTNPKPEIKPKKEIIKKEDISKSNIKPEVEKKQEIPKAKSNKIENQIRSLDKDNKNNTEIAVSLGITVSKLFELRKKLNIYKTKKP